MSKASDSFWANLSDEALVDIELTTDDPENLPNLVKQIPDGEGTPYVEFKYDLRGTGREEFSCVHGNHGHLSGFVFRKGDARFLVGRICGNTIYGEDFDKFTSDFDAAIQRQDALKRVRQLREAIAAFTAWLRTEAESDSWRAFNRLRGQLDNQMPWVFDNLPALAAMDPKTIGGAALPKRLCAEDMNVREEFDRLVLETASVSAMLDEDASTVATKIGAMRARLDGLARRAEAIISLLSEVQIFFQPSSLQAICDFANKHDNPKRRRYSAGLMSLSCKGASEKQTISMPTGFKLPSAAGYEQLRKAIAA